MAIPSLYPPWHVFTVGTVIINSGNNENILGVSADAVIQCSYEYTNCPYKCTENDEIKQIPVEIKCPYNRNNPYYEKYYGLPERYVAQVTSEMFVYSADYCLLATKTDDSVVFKKIDKGESIWDLESEILVDFYGCNPKKKPTKFHKSRNKMKEEGKFFARAHCEIISELPLLFGVEDNLNPRNGTSPYRQSGIISAEDVDYNDLVEKINILMAEAKCVVKDSHNICRQKSSEILIFMLSDSDQMKLLKDDTYTHPVAYAMKGYSLNVKTMRQLVDKLCNALHEKNIPVLCECFNGQWANLAFKSEDGEPLTLLHLLNKSWEMASHLSQRNILLKLRNMSTIKPVDLVSVTQLATYGALIAQSGNITMSVCEKPSGKIYYSLNSNGGHLDGKMLLCHVSLHKVRNITDKFGRNEKQYELDNQNKKGLTKNDIDLISTLQPDLFHDICDDFETENLGYEIGLEDFLLSPKLQILQRILVQLREYGKSDKWSDYTEEDLFPHILMEKNSLMSFTRHDIDIIIKEIDKVTVRKLFSPKDNKDTRAAKIAFLFGSGQLLYNTPQKVPELKQLAHDIVEKFPLPVLQSVYTGVLHAKHKRIWKKNCTINMTAYIPVLDEHFPLFYYPEMSKIRKQIEFRTLDYTHQLTNLHAIICKSGIDNVHTCEFQRISKEYPEILDKGIVFGSLDKQCASLAIQLFLQEVEDKLLENSAYHEAHFVKLVRNWYNACDSRGMPADERVNKLWAFYAYLTKDIDFDRFPGYSQYVKGIPIITYEGILQNISVRLSLYSISHFNTYNARSISSLVCESFFSTVSSKDPGKTGCPKAVDVPKIMADMIVIEEYKQDSMR